ncbi:MAG: glutamate--cysteine ligase [Sandaracinus sp.]|nr:glutamate--cysteine ligase [Sandaracinus sp.]
MPHLFEGFGVEIEWTIVDTATLLPTPLAHVLLGESRADRAFERPRGLARWAGELVRHQVEVAAQSKKLEGLGDFFEAEAAAMNDVLAPHGACLLGGGLHPLFDPTRAQLWPIDASRTLRAWDAVFGCRGHAWTNLQSVHLEIPFEGDEELARLHAATRLVLPLIPALAASSPFVDGRRSPFVDTRVDLFRAKHAKVPQVVGRIVPEPITSQAGYEARILRPMYAAVAPVDPDGLLRDLRLDGRGAVARFDRGVMQIRLIDAQETPRADIAVCAAIATVIRALAYEMLPGSYPIEGSTERLAYLLELSMRDGERAVLDDPAYLRAFGLRRDRVTFGQLWDHLIERCSPAREHAEPLDLIRRHGPLARRMLTRVGSVDRANLEGLCRELSECLRDGRMLLA